MSLITKALKKIQENRTKKGPSAEKIVYLTDTPKSWLKTVMAATLAVGTITAIILSIDAINLAVSNSMSKQSRDIKLERIIKDQGEKINDLMLTVNKSRSVIKNQNHDLNLRLKEVSQNNETNYENLKEAIEDDKQEINYLEKETRNLNQKIESMSISTTQTEGR